MKQQLYINQGFAAWDGILKQYQPQKTLLVCGKQSYRSIEAIVQPLLTQLSGKIITFNEFGKKPCIEDIFRGITLCREENVDLIIAIGGGHCIDTAKAINLLSKQPISLNNANDLAESIRGNTTLIPTECPLIVMPTTCGSGSEATHFAVVYIGSDKFSLAHPSILADWVIADKCLVNSLPHSIAVYTALDALCQAIESYWSVGATQESEEYALNALKIISPHLQNQFTINDQFFTDMVLAANYAGRAINISKTTAPHALSYYLTDQFDVPHGIAVALTLGAVATYTEINAENHTQKKIQTIKNILNFSDEFSQSWYDFIASLDIACKLSDYNLKEEHLEKMVNSVNLQRLANHPINFDTKQLKQVLKSRYI
jgi:alcohol dehydrogenase class IV